MLPKIKNISIGVQHKYYNIDMLDCTIDFDDFDIIKMKLGNKGIDMPPLLENTSMKSLDYLVDEILNLTYLHNVNSVDQSICVNDLDLLGIKYRSLLVSSNDSEITSSFKGKGGYFYISIILKSLSKLRQKQFVHGAWTLTCSILFFFIWYLFIKFHFIKFIFMIIFSLILIFKGNSQYAKYKTIKLEAESYEREQKSVKEN